MLLEKGEGALMRRAKTKQLSSSFAIGVLEEIHAVESAKAIFALTNGRTPKATTSC